MTTGHLNKIAIVGAGGQFGKFITKALVEQGKHKITAISRADSKATIPEGVDDIKKVDYESHSSLVEALKGHDALIITMSVTAPTAQSGLISAAKDAGIHWIMPNEYGGSSDKNSAITKDTKIGEKILAAREEIERAGLSWIGLCCGFWYEFSLAGTEARYGFDFKKKTLTLFDDGNVKIPTSTWDKASLAVARIFALPLESSGGKSPSLADFRNRSVYVDSFFLSQRDMLASVLRVTGDKESDWTITSEPSVPRYERGCKMLSEGNFEGFVILLYTRIFYQDGSADYTARLNNKDLGLPEEDLDGPTAKAIEMAKVSNGHWGFHW